MKTTTGHMRGGGCTCETKVRGPRTTPESFVKKAEVVHGNKYDYSETIFVKSSIPVKIICPSHGLFLQRPGGHLFGAGCPKCGLIKVAKSKSVTTDEFLDRFRKVHGERYDYSLVEIKGCMEKIDIICPEHGIFKKTPSKHVSGQGCPECSRVLKNQEKSMTTEDFVKKATEVYGSKYDYSLSKYTRSCIKIKIICPKHGVFEQTPNNHLMGYECMKCSIEQNAENRRSNSEEFIVKAKKVHGDKYDYSKVCYFDNRTKIVIVCPLHGEFIQEPSSHLNDRGCPLCHESRGERKVALYLGSHGILYQRQKKFAGCRYRRKLSFDFFLPAYNMCIEFDGRQHFFPSKYFGGAEEFDRTVKVDKIKSDFCSSNGINLVRVSYRVKNVESFLDKALSKITVPSL
jgi:hypothetical protein